jgi:hypothetical protein
MNSDIGSDNFATATLRDLGVGCDEFTSTTSLCQGDNDVLLLLEHIGNLGFLALDDDGDLVFDGLSVSGQVVQSDNRSSSSDGVIRKIKVGSGLGEVLLGDLLVSADS